MGLSLLAVTAILFGVSLWLTPISTTILGILFIVSGVLILFERHASQVRTI